MRHPSRGPSGFGCGGGDRGSAERRDMSTVHPAGSRIYGHLWTTPEVSALFTDEGRTQAWLEILAALAQAQAEVGLVPAAAAEAIHDHSGVSRLHLALPASPTRVTR